MGTISLPISITPLLFVNSEGIRLAGAPMFFVTLFFPPYGHFFRRPVFRPLEPILTLNFIFLSPCNFLRWLVVDLAGFFPRLRRRYLFLYTFLPSGLNSCVYCFFGTLYFHPTSSSRVSPPFCWQYPRTIHSVISRRPSSIVSFSQSYVHQYGRVKRSLCGPLSWISLLFAFLLPGFRWVSVLWPCQ